MLLGYIDGTRFISRNIYSPKIFLRVIVEVFNEILEEKTTNEIKQTDLLVEKSAEIYCSNLFRPKRSSTKINHRNVRWIFHRKKQRIFWPINYSSKVSYITWTLPTRHFIIMEMSLSKKTAQSIKTQVTNNTLYRSLSLSLLQVALLELVALVHLKEIQLHIRRASNTSWRWALSFQS